MQQPAVTISVVSHGQNGRVRELLRDLSCTDASQIEVILTENIPDSVRLNSADYPFGIRHITNATRKGFGANHNAAFAVARGTNFCVVNPDVRLRGDPFPALLQVLRDPAVGVVGPTAIGPDGEMQNNARRFPTGRSLAMKILSRTNPIEYDHTASVFYPDWIAGMMMMFRSSTYRDIGGFDERYFLYYEDVDICARIRATGRTVAAEPAATIIHDANRQSWRSPRFTLMHLRSMVRYLSSHAVQPTRASE
jgi:N-acetylglucosaminyl-diphospho-decaprenol L-rhamnosyltransferase